MLSKLKTMIIGLASLSAIGCDQVHQQIESMEASNASTCEGIKAGVIKINKDEKPNMIEIDDIMETPKRLPQRVNLPGKVILSCYGQAYYNDGSKIPIFFFKSENDTNYYFGFEQAFENPHHYMKPQRQLESDADAIDVAPEDETATPTEYY
jgi:hypothetical protein